MKFATRCASRKQKFPGGLSCRRRKDCPTESRMDFLCPRRCAEFWQAARSCPVRCPEANDPGLDRKSTRLNSSHGYISYAVFCLKKKKNIPFGDYTNLSTNIIIHFLNLCASAHISQHIFNSPSVLKSRAYYVVHRTTHYVPRA